MRGEGECCENPDVLTESAMTLNPGFDVIFFSTPSPTVVQLLQTTTLYPRHDDAFPAARPMSDAGFRRVSRQKWCQIRAVGWVLDRKHQKSMRKRGSKHPQIRLVWSTKAQPTLVPWVGAVRGITRIAGISPGSCSQWRRAGLVQLLEIHGKHNENNLFSPKISKNQIVQTCANPYQSHFFLSGKCPTLFLLAFCLSLYEYLLSLFSTVTGGFPQSSPAETSKPWRGWRQLVWFAWKVPVVTGYGSNS